MQKMGWLITLLNKIKQNIVNFFLLARKSSQNFYNYFANSGDDYGNPFGGFARILRYLKKIINMYPAIRLCVLMISLLFINMWLIFFTAKILGAVEHYFWCKALATHKFGGLVEVMRIIKSFVFGLEITIWIAFGIYFNAKKRFYFGEKTVYLDIWDYFEDKVVRFFHWCKTIPQIFSFEKVVQFFRNGGLKQTWFKGKAAAKNHFENFKKTELYAVFMENSFTSQLVYLIILLLVGVVLIEFLVINYAMWVVAWDWIAKIYLLGRLSGAQYANLLRAIFIVFIFLLTITNGVLIDNVKKYVFVEQLLNLDAVKRVHEFFIEKKSFLLRCAFILILVWLTGIFLYVYSFFGPIIGFRLKILCIWSYFFINWAKFVLLSGIFHLCWTFLMRVFYKDVNGARGGYSMLGVYSKCFAALEDIMVWKEKNNTGDKLIYMLIIGVGLVSGLLLSLLVFKAVACAMALLIVLFDIICMSFEIPNIIPLITFIIIFLFFLAYDFGLKKIGDPKNAALIVSVILFLLTLCGVANYDYSQEYTNISNIFINTWFTKSNIFCFYASPLSLFMALLTTFIFPIAIFTAWDRVNYRAPFFYFNIIFLELLVLGSFFTYDLFLFFIFFELTFVPMALIISIWGGRQRKLSATSYLVIYGLLGSAFFLVGIIYLYVRFDTTNYFVLLGEVKNLSATEVWFLWGTFFIPFAIKIPMFPFHIWLPEAHVEAPTSGSIILAAVLLKLGGYGFIRFLIPLFGTHAPELSTAACALALIGMFYAALAAFRQTDVKKIIAYSSISHMNLIVLGIFSFNLKSAYGSVILMMGHGFTSAALFFLIGVLYDRYHTRTLEEFGGLAAVMPVFTRFLFFFIAANFGFPCSVGFLGEFLIFMGVYNKFGILMILLMGKVSILNLCLNIYLFVSICFGPLNTSSGSLFQDLSAKELAVLSVLAAASLMTLIFHSWYSWILLGELLRVVLV